MNENVLRPQGIPGFFIQLPADGRFAVCIFGAEHDRVGERVFNFFRYTAKNAVVPNP